MNDFRTIRRVTRFLSGIRGLRRIPEALQRKFSKSGTVVPITDFDRDMTFHCHLSSHIGGHVFWKGFYSGSQLRLLDGILDPGMVFFDIGANEGEHSLFAAKRLVHGHVYSFEPCTSVYERLRKNVQANRLGNVTLTKKGLSDHAGRVPIYAGSSAAADGSVNEGLGSVYTRPGVTKMIEEIELTTLDQIVEELRLPRLDMMKIDVEGSELAVLTGGEKTLREFRPKIVLEICEETSRAAGYGPDALLDFLAQRNYRFDNIMTGGRTVPLDSRKGLPSRDILCTPF